MNANRGIIGTIVLIIIALVVLGYYNISIQSIIESRFVQENLLYVWDSIVWFVTTGFWWIVNLIKNYSK